MAVAEAEDPELIVEHEEAMAEEVKSASIRGENSSPQQSND